MKITIDIDDAVMKEFERQAARRGRTVIDMAETALRLLLHSQSDQKTIPALPRFCSGGTLVDIANRDALYHAIEGR